MKVLKFLIIASIIAYTAARVVGPQKDDIKKKTKLQPKQEDDSEGVVVDQEIPVANIEVYEVTTAAVTASVEENSVEQSSTSAEVSSEVPIVNTDDSNPINRYCKCSSFECDCCRDFSLPLVPIRGPGCANIRYLEGDRLSVGIKFGNRVLANRIVSGRKATPICLPLPGGFTNFCGKIYGISKKNENFRACLGLELRADEDVEAALRVSCFDFGPKGLRVTDAEPIPVTPVENEDDDDDDDFFGLGGGGDDDDDDDDILGDDADSDDDTPTGQSAGPIQQSSANDDDDDDADYTGLDLLSGDFLDDILGDDEDDSSSADQDRPPAPAKKQNKKKKKAPVTQNVSENEVNGDSSENEEETPISRPAAQNAKPSRDESDEDDDDEDGGFLGLLDDLISDGDEGESDEEQLENEVSEEIVQNEIEDDIEEIAEEVDESATSDPLKDYDEQSIDGTVLDDDIDDEDTEDLDDDKPTGYSGLSLLGLRKFFSRFFH